MIIEIPNENSIVKWKNAEKDEWKVAEISDLIKAYERPPSEPEKVLVASVTFDEDKLKEIVETEVIEKIKSGDLVIRSEERPTGEWIYGEDDCGQDGWFCSECGFFVPWYYQYYEKDIDFIRDYKACPHCLAEMITYTGKDRDTKGGKEE